MSLKDFNLPKNIWKAFKEFLNSDGIDKASILAYYSIFSTLFLLTFAIFIFTKFLGSSDTTIKSIYPFSPDFFSKISPDILIKAEEISTRLKEIGIIGIVFFLFLGFLLIKKIVQFVNEMCETCINYKKINKPFLVRRISEFSLFSILGILLIFNFFATNFISTTTTLFHKNKFLASHINPNFINSLNKFLILYIAPFLVTFLFFFVLYKWIPEKKIYIKGAFIAAIISTILWEIVKRGYTFYLINISLVGKIKGPVIAIILFGFWMEFSMGIMLYGAKLTHILDKEKNDKIKRDK